MSEMIGSKLAADRARARRLRAQWLVDIHEGRATVEDALLAATTIEGTPLRVMPLKRLLAAQPDMGPRQARAAVARVATLLSAERVAARDKPRLPKTLTVGFLLDGRADRRWAWELMRRAPRAPYEGFPF